jgi:hypothetical protein
VLFVSTRFAYLLYLPVVMIMAVNTTTFIIPVLAVAYLVLVYGVLLWWSRRFTAR